MKILEVAGAAIVMMFVFVFEDILAGVVDIITAGG
jgi:hypothetical protein